ncbi:PREDICTED: egl nine homolog 3-like [Rhagoletis zephyria]|uniref:egl nine homolog 3-like n=1 Tax=Rhagoletis zephyria TaxID=28612 RepID=UPI0008115A07|nr:PREDICTED: egl nine homolog 3-like [Rhagoletis zephyria]
MDTGTSDGGGQSVIVGGNGGAASRIGHHHNNSNLASSQSLNHSQSMSMSHAEGTSSFRAQPHSNFSYENTVPMQANSQMNNGTGNATVPTTSVQQHQMAPPMSSVQICDSSVGFGGQQSASSGNGQGNGQGSGVGGGNSNNRGFPTVISNRDDVFRNLTTYCQIILKDMNQYGFCVIDNFLQNGEEILEEVKFLYDKGLFRAGQVVNHRTTSTNTKMIRGDQIIWVEGNETLCNHIGFLIRILDSIITKCNTTYANGEFHKYNISRRTKAMIACYPGNNAKYVRHIDNPNNDGRCITSIYYLNKDYNAQRDGGVLRLFPQMNDGIVANIEPRFNRVIFFFSDKRNPHQVTESSRLRFAITVWYFDDKERERAIERYKEQQQRHQQRSTNDSNGSLSAPTQY